MAVKFLASKRLTALSTDLVTETTTMAGNSSGTNTGGVDYYTYKQITGLTAGTQISKCILDIKSASTNIKVGIYTDNSNQPSTLISEGVSAVSVSDYTLVEIALDSYATVPSNGKVWVAMKPEAEIVPRKSVDSASYSASVHGGGSYSSAMVSTASINGNGTYNVHFGVIVETPKLGTTTATANVTDDLTTDKGWSSNSSDWAYNTSDYLYFNPIRRNTTSQDMYIDLQDSDYLGSGNNLHASKWVVRLGKFETVSLASGNADFYFGVSDGTGDDSSTQQSVYFALNGNSSDAQISGAATTGNMNGSGRTYGSFSPTITNSEPNELWLEMIRDSDNYTLNYYSDEYSTLASTATIAKSGISNLRYIKFTNDSEATSSSTWVAKLHGAIKIYNGITAVTSDSAVNAQTNTIAEETDTGIHRIWSGSAWTEVA